MCEIVVSERPHFFRSNLLKWSQEHFRDLPWRKTFNPYEILIAEIMLQQTFSAKVVPIYNEFINKYPNVVSLNKAKLKSIEKLIYPLGLKYRAGKMKEMAKSIVDNHKCQVPQSKEMLMSLPQVGEYTSSAVMCFAFGESVPVIDSNVTRVYGRYFGIRTKTPYRLPSKEIYNIALEVFHNSNARQFNYGLLDFAADICTHYHPKCHFCIMKKMCLFPWSD